MLDWRWHGLGHRRARLHLLLHMLLLVVNLLLLLLVDLLLLLVHLLVLLLLGHSRLSRLLLLLL